MNDPHPHADPRLSRVLQSWKVDPQPHPEFSQAVWRRIERRQRPTRTTAIADVLAPLLQWLTQPRAAALCLLIWVAVGSAAGWRQGHASSRDQTLGLQGRYVASIDPFAGSPR